MRSQACFLIEPNIGSRLGRADRQTIAQLRNPIFRYPSPPGRHARPVPTRPVLRQAAPLSRALPLSRMLPAGLHIPWAGVAWEGSIMRDARWKRRDRWLSSLGL